MFRWFGWFPLSQEYISTMVLPPPIWSSNCVGVVCLDDSTNIITEPLSPSLTMFEILFEEKINKDKAYGLETTIVKGKLITQ